ncbi:MAG: ABC transporter substrate-binding protein [Candidatus Parabeggiatoa sp. nov. 3]|nr:MAG: ABC transporter substrate-binding protein [Gammaproteobacteria bacterium]
MKIFSILGIILLCALTFIIGYKLPTSQNPAPETTPSQITQAKTFHWKMVTTWIPNLPVFQDNVEKMAEEIETMSAGRLKVKVYAGGELIPPLETFHAVSQGVVQMGHGAAYYWAGEVPAAQFMSTVPFGMKAKGMNAWLYSGGGLELWRDLYKPFNVIPFPAGNSGVQMGGWFNKKINSIDDFKGLKMRIPGLGGKVLAKAGGTAELLPGSEVSTALERGRLDATEWVGPFHDKRLGLYRAAKYYYYPGWHEPGTTLELIVNSQAFAELPADLQKIVEMASYALNQRIYSQFEAFNIKALRELKQEHHVNVLAFPPEVLKELKRLTVETLDEEADKNADFKRIYEAYKQFQADDAAWNAVSEDAYRSMIIDQ